MFETSTENIFEEIVSEISKEEIVVENTENKKRLDNLIVFSSFFGNDSYPEEQMLKLAKKIFLRYFSTLSWIECSTNENRFPIEEQILYNKRDSFAFSFKRYAPYEIFSCYKMCYDLIRKYDFKKNGVLVTWKHYEFENCNGYGFKRFLDYNRKVFGVIKDFNDNYNVDLVCGIYERRIQDGGLDKSFKSYFDKMVFKNNRKIELKKLRNLGLSQLLCSSRGIASADDFDWINEHRFIRAYIADVTMKNLQSNKIPYLRKPPFGEEWIRSFSCCNIINSKVYKNKDGDLIWSVMCIKPTNNLAIRRIMFAMEISCSHKKCPKDVIYKAFERLLDRECAEKIRKEWNKKEYVFKDYNVLIDTGEYNVCISECQKRKKNY